MKKFSVTVAVPVYNEAENIGSFIDSLFRQIYKRIRLDKIIIYTDGSTDDSVNIVRKKMKSYPLLYLKAGKVQKGKFPRLNRIYKDNTSDILIVLDGDISIEGNHFVENFAMVLVNDPKAMLVSAHEIPIIPKNFLGKIIASSYVMWDYIRWSIPDCDHVQNLYARATAYRGSFAKTLYIPDKATEERLYLYLMASKTNGFRYTRKAVIRYLPVSTIYDYIKLSERAFGRPQPAINELFGYDATYLYSIPGKYKKRGMIRSFLHNPLYTVLGIGFGLWLGRTTIHRKSTDSAIWEISLSSKKKIAD